MLVLEISGQHSFVGQAGGGRERTPPESSLANPPVSSPMKWDYEHEYESDSSASKAGLMNKLIA